MFPKNFRSLSLSIFFFSLCIFHFLDLFFRSRDINAYLMQLCSVRTVKIHIFLTCILNPLKYFSFHSIFSPIPQEEVHLEVNKEQGMMSWGYDFYHEIPRMALMSSDTLVSSK